MGRRMKIWDREDLEPTRGAIEYRLSGDADSLTPQRIQEAQGRICISEEFRCSLDSLCRSLIERNPRAWAKNSGFQPKHPLSAAPLAAPQLHTWTEQAPAARGQRPRMSSWKWSPHERKQKVSRGLDRAQSAAATQRKTSSYLFNPGLIHY